MYFLFWGHNLILQVTPLVFAIIYNYFKSYYVNFLQFYFIKFLFLFQVFFILLILFFFTNHPIIFIFIIFFLLVIYLFHLLIFYIEIDLYWVKEVLILQVDYAQFYLDCLKYQFLDITQDYFLIAPNFFLFMQP